MMTMEDIKLVLKMLNANYGEDFYKGTNEADVMRLWAVQFAMDDPKEVMQAVQNCISTLAYKPRIADIRKRMAGNAMQGQMTATEAFQRIAQAVNDAYDRESASNAFNGLPPLLRKLVGFPAQLISWHNVSDEAFQTVIMSAIRESYRELAQREADYHALPAPLQKAEEWRIEAPPRQALPAVKVPQTVDEILADCERKSAEFRERYGLKPNYEKYGDRVQEFMKPI